MAIRKTRSGSDVNFRIIGSKIQVAGWTVATCMLWTLKLCVSFFYLRLTVRMFATYVEKVLLTHLG